MESILEDLSALPPGKQAADKFYLGFFMGDRLAAVMDLILDYPERGIAFLGFFMMEPSLQGCGAGSAIIQECLAYLASMGFRKARLAIDRGNPQSREFWTKNGFAPVSYTHLAVYKSQRCVQAARTAASSTPCPATRTLSSRATLAAIRSALRLL